FHTSLRPHPHPSLRATFPRRGKATTQQQRGVAGVRRDQPVQAAADESLQCGGGTSIVVALRPRGLSRQQGRRGAAREGEGETARACFEQVALAAMLIEPSRRGVEG